jgi:hypothetical protein
VRPTVETCSAYIRSRVFAGYAYGDPLPTYSQFVGEEGDVDRDAEPIWVYVRCERETGHLGKHLARGTSGWTDDDERLRDRGDYR